MSTHLPVSEPSAVLAYVGDLVSRRRRLVGQLVVLHVLATVAGLAAPALIGGLVEAVRSGTTTAYVDRTVLLLLVALTAQTVLTRAARYRGFVFGELTLAELREGFVQDSLDMPLGAVETAGSGELVTRTTRDVDALQWTAQRSLPEAVVATLQTALTVGAALVVGGWWVALPLALGLPALVATVRWYLARARDGYLREHESWTFIASSLAETVDGARTVEALRLEDRRLRRIARDVASSYAAERYTLWLRTGFFPVFEATVHAVPTAATVLVGGWLYVGGHVDLGQVTAATLYVQMLADPMDRLMSVLDELQTGSVSLARLLGVREVPQDRVVTGRAPACDKIDATDVRFAYDGERDVLHGLSLDLRVGERLAVVGPSGAGKSTLGRLLAGIHPPRTGSVTVGDVGLTELDLPSLRRRVALVTQENHVFAGTLRDNVARSPTPRRSPTTRCGAPWPPSTPRTGPPRSPTGSTPASAPVGAGSARPRCSRSRSRGWCWSTRTPSCSTRRPRWSTRARRATSSARWPRCWRAAPSSRSRTGCSAPTTPTASPSSRTGWSPRSAPTTSWSPATGPTPPSGAPGRPDGRGRSGSLDHRPAPPVAWLGSSGDRRDRTDPPRGTPRAGSRGPRGDARPGRDDGAAAGPRGRPADADGPCGPGA
ncbi:ABC transporter ATP-binding protein [Nocardioides marmoribigeumensis]|uniref:ABC-type multidrug transport system fused ATPase/permease subunit n=1 Tax=Nocardioides marmoribigeumensis TaxID=433649 RepID=A0ABU2BZS2_9ACTN|nr:ABC-type multidrug transport system fused ATPase/permease subunit [Nocardioides marmoribigeumensis]